MSVSREEELARRLAWAQSSVGGLQAQLDAAKAARRAAIEQALAVGWSKARVGRSLGVTRQRVAQLREKS